MAAPGRALSRRLTGRGSEAPERPLYTRAVGSEETGFRSRSLAAVVAAQSVLFWGVQLARGPGTSADEFFCPTGGMLLEAGLPLRSDLLMLTDFCGGCAVFTLSARWVFEVLPAQVWSWRLIPFVISLLILAGLWRLGSLLGGHAGAVAAASLFVVSPPAYRHMAIRGFANHVEVMALVLAAMVMVTWVHRKGRVRDAFLLGLLTGGAVFVDYIAAFLVASVGLVWLSWGSVRRHPLALLAGLGIGVSPWFLVRMLPPARSSSLHVHGRTLDDLLGAGVSLGDRLGVLFGPSFWGNLFAPDFEFQPWIGLLWSILAMVGFVALGLAARQGVTAQVVFGGIVLFVAEWLVLAPGLPTWPPVPRGGGESIHYLVPLLTLLPAAVAALWGEGPLRRAALPVTVGLGLLGLVGVGGDFLRGWELDGMTRVPVGTHPGAVNISVEDIPPLEMLAEGDLDEVLGIRPDRLVARRAVLAGLGRTIAGELPHWTNWDRRQLARFVDRLSPGDARSFYWGLVEDGVPETEWPEPLPGSLLTALGPWSPDRLAALQRQVRSRPARERAATHSGLGGARARELAGHLPKVEDEGLRALFAWEIGVSAGVAVEPVRQSERGVVEQLEEARRLLPPLPPELEPLAIDGILETVVEDRCADSGACAVLRSAIPEHGLVIDAAECTWHLRCS